MASTPVFIYPPFQVTVDTGALATAAKQDQQTALLTTIDADTGNIATSTASIDSKVLTDTQLRASPVPVSGPLTDTQLRATAVPVSGPLTDVELRASAVPVSGPLTDAQLRATDVPVSVSNFPATQPISAVSLPLPTGAATEATLASIDGNVIKADTDNVTVVSSALPTGAATSSNQTTGAQKTQISKSDGTAVDIKPLNVQVTGTDNGLIVNSVIHGLTTAGGGSYVDVKVTPSGALTVDATVSSSALPTGAATEATLNSIDGQLSTGLIKADTDNVTVVSSALPTGAATESTLSTLNGKVPANLTVSSTRLLVDGSGVIQPVSGTVNAAQSGTWNINNVSGTVSLPTGASTEATLAALSQKTAAGLVPEKFDYQSITYVGATTDISTVTYKLGGSGGTTVATLTMGYDGSNRLTSVTKT